MREVWHCGGGTQSIAIAALIVTGKLPKPDFSVIADTGYERGTTWAYLDFFLTSQLRTIGVDLVRAKASEFAYKHDGLFNNKGTLLVPAFSSSTEAGGKMSNFCTTYWKKDVADNYLRRIHGIKPGECLNWIGFSIDEHRRAVRMMRSKDYQAGRIRFPLIDDVPMRRRDSIQLVRNLGWPEPPRSNCFHCPNQSNAEWLSLPAEEFQKAVELERIARARDPQAYFHSSRVPLDQVDFSSQAETARSCDSGMCFV